MRFPFFSLSLLIFVLFTCFGVIPPEILGIALLVVTGALFFAGACVLKVLGAWGSNDES